MKFLSVCALSIVGRIFLKKKSGGGGQIEFIGALLTKRDYETQNLLSSQLQFPRSPRLSIVKLNSLRRLHATARKHFGS